MLVVDGKIVNTRNEKDVRNDFQRFRASPHSEFVDCTTEWTARSECPTPKKLALIFKCKHIGQQLAEYMHWTHRIQTSTRWLPSGVVILEKWKTDSTFLVGAKQRVAKCTRRRLNDEQLAFEVVRSNSALMTLTHFRAGVSKYFCDTYKSRNVLDFSAGWGDRLTGFLGSETVQCITLIDPRPGSIQKCVEQHRFVNSDKELRVHQDGAEVVLPTLSDNSVDLIVSSPPYFNLEHYGETEEESVGQIRCKVSSLEAYIETFLKPVLQHSSRILARGGVLAINIDDNPRINVLICEPALNIMRTLSCMQLVGTAALRKGTGFGQCLRTKTWTKAEPVYIFQKG